MSVLVQSKVWKAKMPSLAFKVVALKLADHANDDGENVYPSASRLVDATGCAHSTVQEVIANMLAVGLLRVENEGFGNRKGRSTVIKTLDVEMLDKLASGELAWVKNGRQYNLEPARLGSVSDHPSGERRGTPPVSGGVYNKEETSVETSVKEPPLNSPHLSAGGTSDVKCSEEEEGEAREFEGWARGWDNASRSAVDEIRGSATSSHVASEFVDRVRATRFPSRQVDGASYVRQVKSRLGKFGAETLKSVAIHCLERHSRALPDVAELVTVAEAVERRKRAAATPATPTGDGATGAAFRAALEKRMGPDWHRAWGASLVLTVAANGRPTITSNPPFRAKYAMQRHYDDIRAAATEALGEAVAVVELARVAA